MSTHLLLEAAVRSLVMGAIIWAALRLMRIEQVRARRTAWLLALAGALAMPMLVGAQIGPRLLPDLATLAPRAQGVAGLTAASTAAATSSPTAQSEAPSLGAVYGDYRGRLSGSHAGMMQAPLVRSGAPSLADTDDGPTLGDTALALAVFGYCVVAAVLSLRLCAGVGFALRLRNQAERVIFPFDPELDVRTSARVASPVTIGSSVLLPSNYADWDGATLSVVLSHERAHVRQRDFLVHALAGLHCALFWFNPFSWWLQRQLAELGEALSDCAAVEQAESRAGYAEILLAFATRARWPVTGVAMANASNLTPRIERLLNDQGFERSFVKARRLPFIAAGVVALAMFASTSMVRVHAAPTLPNPPAAPDTPPAPVAPPAPVTPAGSITPPTPATPAAPTPASPATVSPPPPPAAVTPPVKKVVIVKRRVHRDADADADADAEVDADAGDRNVVIEDDDVARDEEGVLAIKSDHSHMMFDSGNRLPSQSGDYIYFRHNGKTYLIQDPQIIAKAQALLAPMKLLGEQQRLLGSQQSLLGEKQLKLSSTQGSIKLVESPEFKHQMEQLEKKIRELDLPHLSVKIDQQSLDELQAHLGEIQAHLGELQLDLGMRQWRFGEEQGKLGEQQALLGEQQRKLIEDVRRQLKPIIEQAIREGRGKAIPEE